MWTSICPSVMLVSVKRIALKDTANPDLVAGNLKQEVNSSVSLLSRWHKWFWWWEISVMEEPHMFGQIWQYFLLENVNTGNITIWWCAVCLDSSSKSWRGRRGLNITYTNGVSPLPLLVKQLWSKIFTTQNIFKDVFCLIFLGREETGKEECRGWGGG